MSEVIDFCAERRVRQCLAAIVGRLRANAAPNGVPDLMSYQDMLSDIADPDLYTAIDRATPSTLTHALIATIARLRGPPWHSRAVLDDVGEILGHREIYRALGIAQLPPVPMAMDRSDRR